MAEIWGNGVGGGQGGQFPLEQWFYEMPVCTRWWTTATVLTSLLVQCHVLTPFQLFYSFRAVFLKSQVILPFARVLYVYMDTNCSVLATAHYIRLLRPAQPRPALPRLVSPALLPSPGRILWKLRRRLLLAAPLRHLQSSRPISAPVAPLPRLLAVVQPGLYLEPQKPRHKAQLFGLAGLLRAVSAVGAHGVQSRGAWDCAEG